MANDEIRSAGWLCGFIALAASSLAQAVDCSHIAVSGTTLTMCRADVRRDDLHIFLNDDSGKPLRTFDALERQLQAQGKRLAFAMNAGMFHADHRPVGLLIEQHRQIAPLSTAAGSGNFFMKPNGVFFIDAQGARVVDAAKFSQAPVNIVLATQSGPLLVSGGALHPKLDPNSTSRYIRNGVGVDPSGTVVFAASADALTLYEFATIFRDVLKCPNALYLDGSVSSVYAPSLKERVQRAELGPIIAVVDTVASTTSAK
jgi:uncharacterized protein YigE (DUF2233 family)